MLVEKKIHNEEDGSIGYIENIYESTNILSTTFFPKTKILYIAFYKGNVYSYGNITEDVYNELQDAESQGKYFYKNIRSNPDKYPHLKEFKLLKSEIDEKFKIINEWKIKKENQI